MSKNKHKLKTKDKHKAIQEAQNQQFQFSQSSTLDFSNEKLYNEDRRPVDFEYVVLRDDMDYINYPLESSLDKSIDFVDYLIQKSNSKQVLTEPLKEETTKKKKEDKTITKRRQKKKPLDLYSKIEEDFKETIRNIGRGYGNHKDND